MNSILIDLIPQTVHTFLIDLIPQTVNSILIDLIPQTVNSILIDLIPQTVHTFLIDLIPQTALDYKASYVDHEVMGDTRDRVLSALELPISAKHDFPTDRKLKTFLSLCTDMSAREKQKGECLSQYLLLDFGKSLICEPAFCFRRFLNPNKHHVK